MWFLPFRPESDVKGGCIVSTLSCPLVNYSALSCDDLAASSSHLVLESWGVAPPRGSADLDLGSSAPSAPTCRASVPSGVRGRGVAASR